ncbi:MAG: helix-turn-helix domain-containing protein [Pseudomonadota bacterium]|nr:helix-turn-helix domain-containing protein [Pseudomonadota bacterium]
MTERESGFGTLAAGEGAAAPSTQPAPLAPVATPATAGGMLRQIRESAGVDLALLASAMKVSPQKLQALEEDRLDALPDVTFARGLASAICRAFGTDPAPVLERMPASVPGLRAPDKPLNQPMRPSGDASASLGGRFSKPLLVAVAVLLLGAAALWLLPTLPIQLGAPASEETAGTTSEPVTPEPMLAQAPEESASEPPMPAASAAQAPASAASAVLAATPPAVTPSTDLLALAATGETWVTVRDASGTTLLNRALASGDNVGVNGTPPLSVTIGRKDAVTVTVRGEPFNHRNLGNSAVARFQVK